PPLQLDISTDSIDSIQRGISMFGRKSTTLHGLGRLTAVVIGWVVLGSCLAFGQGATATMSGIVRDASGAVLPGVSISVKNAESGLTRTALSNETGAYNVQLLPVGPYEVTAELAGFRQQVRRGINLSVGQEAVVNLTLEVGSVAEQVTVTEEAPLVNTT